MKTSTAKKAPAKPAAPEKTAREKVDDIMAELTAPTKAEVIEWLSFRLRELYEDSGAEMAVEMIHYTAAIRLLEAKP